VSVDRIIVASSLRRDLYLAPDSAGDVCLWQRLPGVTWDRCLYALAELEPAVASILRVVVPTGSESEEPREQLATACLSSGPVCHAPGTCRSEHGTILEVGK
jgi:hypothetical protein